MSCCPHVPYARWPPPCCPPPCVQCAPLPCCCPRPRPPPCAPRPPGPPCALTDYAHRSLVSRNLEVAAGEAEVIRFDSHEHYGGSGGIDYHNGIFCLSEPGVYTLGLTVCVVASSADPTLGDNGSNIAIGVKPISGGFRERFVYARVRASPAAATSPASNVSVVFSAEIEVNQPQLLQFVVKSIGTPSEAQALTIRAAQNNPDGTDPCTFASVRLVCRGGPGCSPNDCH